MRAPVVAPGVHRSGSTGSEGRRYGAATELASELVLNGLRRLKTQQWPGWQGTITETEECGYHLMATGLRRVQSIQGLAAALFVLKQLALAKDVA
jgi:hypothetical protein